MISHPLPFGYIPAGSKAEIFSVTPVFLVSGREISETALAQRAVVSLMPAYDHKFPNMDNTAYIWQFMSIRKHFCLRHC